MFQVENTDVILDRALRERRAYWRGVGVGILVGASFVLVVAWYSLR